MNIQACMKEVLFLKKCVAVRVAVTIDGHEEDESDDDEIEDTSGVKSGTCRGRNLIMLHSGSA